MVSMFTKCERCTLLLSRISRAHIEVSLMILGTKTKTIVIPIEEFSTSHPVFSKSLIPPTDLLSIIQRLPDKWSVILYSGEDNFGAKDRIGGISIRDDTDTKASFDDVPAYTRYDEFGLILCEWRSGGVLHRATGPARVYYDTIVDCKYFYKGQHIPISLIDAGIIDGSNITDLDLVSVTIAGY